MDDDAALAGTEIDGVPVLGPLSLLPDMENVQLVVCTGHPGNYVSRLRIVRRLGLPNERFATLVHPAASIPRSVRLGRGSVALATVVATTGVQVGAHVALMPGAVLTHDDVVGDYATFGSGVRLAGRVVVGEGAYIGAGALVRESRRIGPWALVGMGSVVLTDIPAGEVWAGVPARKLRMADIPADLLAEAHRDTGLAGVGT